MYWHEEISISLRHMLENDKGIHEIITIDCMVTLYKIGFIMIYIYIIYW